MEREIKFRAWSIEKQCWAYFGINDVPNWVHLVEVEQYIGLHDKNGKKIFEGDLFKDSTGISLVTWNEYFASFCLRRNGWMYDHFFGEAVDPEDGEIIGNRYENPELLTIEEVRQ
jgi:hypothetical protein